MKSATDTLFDIAGRSILVTGGTRGLGALMARGLIGAGANVIISSRSAEACDRAADDLGCLAVPADVSLPEGVEILRGAVDRHLDGHLDVLVNNAGTTWGAPLDDFPRRGWDRVLTTNLVGLFELTTALLPALRRAAAQRGNSRVINIGSVDGLRVPVFENYSYSASKAAVHHLTRHLAATLVHDGVLVNAIAPGAFPTDMTANALITDSGLDLITRAIPLRRLGSPDDIVGVIRFMSSAASDYMTGVVLPVDGGITGCVSSS